MDSWSICPVCLPLGEEVTWMDCQRSSCTHDTQRSRSICPAVTVTTRTGVGLVPGWKAGSRDYKLTAPGVDCSQQTYFDWPMSLWYFNKLTVDIYGGWICHLKSGLPTSFEKLKSLGILGFFPALCPWSLERRNGFSAEGTWGPQFCLLFSLPLNPFLALASSAWPLGPLSLQPLFYVLHQEFTLLQPYVPWGSFCLLCSLLRVSTSFTWFTLIIFHSDSVANWNKQPIWGKVPRL